jgi:hypothetical protein
MDAIAIVHSHEYIFTSQLRRFITRLYTDYFYGMVEVPFDCTKLGYDIAGASATPVENDVDRRIASTQQHTFHFLVDDSTFLRPSSQELRP